jgi:hypothetical protein
MAFEFGLDDPDFYRLGGAHVPTAFRKAGESGRSMNSWLRHCASGGSAATCAIKLLRLGPGAGDGLST